MANKKFNIIFNRKLNILLFLLILVIILIIISLFVKSKESLPNIKENNEYEYNLDLNKGYAKEDIDDIEKVRNLFSSYLSSADYSMFNQPNFDLTERYSKDSEITSIAQKLLSKYTKIKIDNENILTFDKNSRCIIIRNGPCTLNTNVNVDIPVSHFNYYLFNESFVPASNGTWCVFPNGLDDTFVFFQFGQEDNSRKIKSNCALVMLDKRYINNDFYNYSDGSPYEEYSKFYLFKSTVSYEFYIYSVENKKWIPCGEIRNAKATNDFVSLIDTDNNFYLYCVEHSKLLKVGKSKALLEPAAPNEQQIYKSFLDHSKCTD